MNMYIRSVISFDPIKEFNAIESFKQRNPDWKEEVSTTATFFIKEERWHFEPNDYSYGDVEEPEINPCRGCTDYDGQGGCKSNGGCGAKMEMTK